MKSLQGGPASYHQRFRDCEVYQISQIHQQWVAWVAGSSKLSVMDCGSFILVLDHQNEFLCCRLLNGPLDHVVPCYNSATLPTFESGHETIAVVNVNTDAPTYLFTSVARICCESFCFSIGKSTFFFADSKLGTCCFYDTLRQLEVTTYFRLVKYHISLPSSNQMWQLELPIYYCI